MDLFLSCVTVLKSPALSFVSVCQTASEQSRKMRWKKERKAETRGGWGENKGDCKGPKELTPSSLLSSKHTNWQRDLLSSRQNTNKLRLFKLLIRGMKSQSSLLWVIWLHMMRFIWQPVLREDGWVDRRIWVQGQMWAVCRYSLFVSWGEGVNRSGLLCTCWFLQLSRLFPASLAHFVCTSLIFLPPSEERLLH